MPKSAVPSGPGQPCSLSASPIDRPHRPASGAVWLRSAIFCSPSASEPTRKLEGSGEWAMGSAS